MPTKYRLLYEVIPIGSWMIEVNAVNMFSSKNSAIEIQIYVAVEFQFFWGGSIWILRENKIQTLGPLTSRVQYIFVTDRFYPISLTKDSSFDSFEIMSQIVFF